MVFLVAVLATLAPLCPEQLAPDDPHLLFFSSDGPETRRTTIGVDEETVSYDVTYTLNAEGAVFEKPTTDIWSGTLFCFGSPILDGPEEVSSELRDLTIHIAPVDGDGGEMARDDSSGCGAGVGSHPIPCQPKESCTRSWRVTFIRPGGIDERIVVEWMFAVHAVGLDEAPAEARLSHTVTRLDAVPDPSPQATSADG